MSRILTKEQVEIAKQTAMQPFNEPTEIVDVPFATGAELLASGWQPKREPENVRWRTEHNVATGEVTHYELTDLEYAERHLAKMRSRNEYVLRKRAEKAKADRDAAMQRMLDKFMADEAKGK